MVTQGITGTSNSSPCTTMKIAASCPSTASQRSRRIVSRRTWRRGWRKSEAATSVMSGSLAARRSDHKLPVGAASRVSAKSCACRRNGPMNGPHDRINGAASSRLPATDPAGSAAIEVAHLVKLYKTTRAVDDVSFRIARGSITGLLGGNGAGKTTTIAMIMGLVLPTSGRDPGAGAFDARAERRRARPDEFRKSLCRHADAAHGAAEPDDLRPALCRGEFARAHRAAGRRSRSRRFSRPRQRQALGRAEDPRGAGQGADQPAGTAAAGRADRLARSRYRRLGQAASRDLPQEPWRDHPARLAQHARGGAAVRPRHHHEARPHRGR